VLLADCDPQGNSTSMFDPDEDVEFDIYDLIKGEAPVEKVIRSTRISNLDLVPSTLVVAKLDQELVTMHSARGSTRDGARAGLSGLRRDHLGLVAESWATRHRCLDAAQWLIVPTDASKWGRRWGETCSGMVK